MDGAETSPVSTSTRPDRQFNVLRWAQMFCSLLCLILAGVLYPKEKSHATTIVVVLTVSSTFWFTATMDVVSRFLKERTRFRSWLMVAVTGFLMFCMCAGLVFRTIQGGYRVLKINLGAASLISALLFLLDVLWMGYRAKLGGREKYSRRSTVEPSIHGDRDGDNVDKAVSVCFLFENEYYECPKIKKRYAVTVKPPRRDIIPSYGGTFPVSRDLTPLPSPDPKGLTNEPRRFVFSNAPNRPSRRVSISPSRRLTMSPSRRTVSPSTYVAENQNRPTGLPFQQTPRASSASCSSSRRTQTDAEQDHRMRTTSSRLDDHSTNFPEWNRPERDSRTQWTEQWTSTRAGILDTVPERDGS